MAVSKVDAANQIENKLPQKNIANNINFRNIIINGDMSIAQRSTSKTGVGNGDSGYHTVDRFKFEENGAPTGEFTMSQDTDVPSGEGFSNSLKLDCTTADTALASGDFGSIQQKIEAQNLQYLKFGTSSANSITLSFWVKSTKTGTYQVNMRNQDNASTFSQTYSISSSDTWQKVTMTFTGDTGNAFNNDNGEGIRLEWVLFAGTDYTSGTFASTWNDNLNNNVRGVNHAVNLLDSTSNDWYITGIQLEAGEVASDFEFLPFDVTYRRCCRYYKQVGGAISTTRPEQIKNQYAGGTQSTFNNTVFFNLLDFNAVDMRASPTLGESGDIFITNFSSNQRTVNSATTNNFSMVGIGYSGSKLSNATSQGLNFNSGSKLTIDAEL